MEGFDADEVDEGARMDIYSVDRESAEARPPTGESNEADGAGGTDGEDGIGSGDAEDDGEGHSDPEVEDGAGGTVDRAGGSTKRPYEGEGEVEGEGEGEGEGELMMDATSDAKRRKKSA